MTSADGSAAGPTRLQGREIHIGRQGSAAAKGMFAASMAGGGAAAPPVGGHRSKSDFKEPGCGRWLRHQIQSSELEKKG